MPRVRRESVQFTDIKIHPVQTVPLSLTTSHRPPLVLRTTPTTAMGPKPKKSTAFTGEVMEGRSSIRSYFSKAVPAPDPAPAPAPAPHRPVWGGLPDVGGHLRAGGEQPSPSAGNGTGGWKPWNSSAISVEPAEGERGELSTPPSSLYSIGILGVSG
ncbi:unnamed protein product [Ectocarpus sp. 4 AP-2014]